MLLDEIIRKSLEEDLGSGDITTRYLDLEPKICTAYMIAKAEGILAGTDVARQVFKAVDPELKITLYRKDGDFVAPKEEIM
ncbi:MAG: nicotinate-nucleotide diphosphorylase (carboxylating), partial [Candidatus Cloacimonetes bacterium]|nr:nicotinate-nucleotide diphosphorylase (carboxylating) [Candidatus Cloacimonadota bacterium]